MSDAGAIDGRHGNLASVRVEDDGQVAIARIAGEVDISNASAIAARLSRVPASLRGLIVDLTEVGYVDSAGLRLIQELHSRLEMGSQRLVVVSPAHTPPRRMLELTALDLTIAVRDTVADAAELVPTD